MQIKSTLRCAICGFICNFAVEIINYKDMNTITIDSNIYQYVANYAAKRRASVKSIVESFILSLNDHTEFDSVAVDEQGSGDRYLNHLYTNKKWGGRTS